LAVFNDEVRLYYPYRPEQKDGTDESIELDYDEIRRKSMAHVCSFYF